mmetsp:Transcript_9109/g.10626  ORF Transcript_9109/g.10626 Transcript_9109/m.10626 type:complete len:83 (-) Transcript_9109:1064-1312(-)
MNTPSGYPIDDRPSPSVFRISYVRTIPEASIVAHSSEQEEHATCTMGATDVINDATFDEDVVEILALRELPNLKLGWNKPDV